MKKSDDEILDKEIDDLYDALYNRFSVLFSKHPQQKKMDKGIASMSIKGRLKNFRDNTLKKAEERIDRYRGEMCRYEKMTIRLEMSERKLHKKIAQLEKKLKYSEMAVRQGDEIIKQAKSQAHQEMLDWVCDSHPTLHGVIAYLEKKLKETKK